MHVELAKLAPEAATVGVAASAPADDELEDVVGDGVVAVLGVDKPLSDAATVGVVVNAPLEDVEPELEATVGVVADIPLGVDEPEAETVGVIADVPFEDDVSELEAGVGVVIEAPLEDDEPAPAVVVGDIDGPAPLELLAGVVAWVGVDAA